MSLSTVPRVAPGSRQAAQWARELEAELTDYPEERGQILLEAGDCWHRAGNHERAIELLTQAIAAGGEDGGNARVTLAEVLFDLDRPEQAWAELAELRAQRPPSPTPYHQAAELLEHRDNLDQALTWINMAVARLTEQEMAQQRQESGLFSYANHLLAGRRRIRGKLNLAADDLDNSVLEFDQSLLDAFTDTPVRHGHSATLPPEVRVLFWLRNEVPRAHQQWPDLVQHTDADTMLRDRETANRELTANGVTRITMVPLTAARLAEYAARTGADPAQENTRHACMNEIINDGATISWPPGRNTPCWCGSNIKYKKCCGRPAPL